MRYFGWDGTRKFEITADSVAAVDDDGNEYELHWRTTDKEMSLSIQRGTLCIAPRASNTVRLFVKK